MVNQSIPPCVKCGFDYVYEDRQLFVCPECGYEWDPKAKVSEEEVELVKDANGITLRPGDTVTLIKDLKIKGSSSIAKIGTKVKILNLAEGDHNIDCKIEGIGPMMLKSIFVKKK